MRVAGETGQLVWDPTWTRSSIGAAGGRDLTETGGQQDGKIIISELFFSFFFFLFGNIVNGIFGIYVCTCIMIIRNTREV